MVSTEVQSRRSIEALAQGLQRSFGRLVEVYRESGGYLFHGYGGQHDPDNYKGPTFWSEGDAQLRLALALEDEFPGRVHIEVPVCSFMFANFNSKGERRQFIDVVVSDLSDFDPDDPTQIFAEREHDVFIEIKFTGVSSPPFQKQSIDTIFEAFPKDLRRLEWNLALNRCRVAAALLVDDRGLLDDVERRVAWSTRVMPLLLSPPQLERVDVAKQLCVKLPAACPGCGSPRVAAYLFGLPLPEHEEASRRKAVILGGCEKLGFGLDPTYGCLDCGHDDSRFAAGDKDPPTT